jgi:uncharacterized membrane protein YtjA (UPF0391 family)
MLGWMILFALMALPGAAAAMAGHPAVALTTTTVLFAFLFLLTLLISLVRGRAR